MIELVKEVKEGEIITENYLTPVFLTSSFVYEATDFMQDVTENPNKKAEKQIIQELLDFVTRVYKNQFTKEELENGLHAPDLVSTLYAQVVFIARGEQDDATKKFLRAKKA